MKKQIMASVLLASMMFAAPGYADYELGPDESNSYDKYKSPLEQSYGPVVNDRPKAEPADDDSEAFARVAGQLAQRTVSNIIVSDQRTRGKEVLLSHKKNNVPAIETEKGKESEQDAAAAARKVALEKADLRAEEVLSETDDSFEPAQDKEYPGYEYQARRQIKSFSEPESLGNGLQQNHDAALKPAEIKSADRTDLSGSHKDENSTEMQASLVGNEEKPAPADEKGNRPKEKKGGKKLPLIIQGMTPSIPVKAVTLSLKETLLWNREPRKCTLLKLSVMKKQEIYGFWKGERYGNRPTRYIHVGLITITIRKRENFSI